MNLKNKKKLGYGAKSVALIAAVLAVVFLVNIGATVLSQGLLWYGDLTADRMYTPTEEFMTRMEGVLDGVNADRTASGQEGVKVEIIFCAEPDMLKGNWQMRYIYYTALNLQKAFPESIEVRTEDVWSNPSVVDAYRSNSYSSIYQSNIIIASGSEFRVTNAKTYFVYNSDDGSDEEPWAYNGEKKFLQFITAVTKAEAPVCGVTYNHDEPFDPEKPFAEQEYSELLNVIEKSGYDVVFLDLERDEIPADCRLLLTFDPQIDFKTKKQSELGVSELSKLDAFLSEYNSYMVFVDADTPSLPNLEELLEEWGIQFYRHTEGKNVLGNYQVVSTGASLDSLGLSVIGTYETEAIGGSITENMQDLGGSPKVVFGNVMPIQYSKTYEEAFVLADEEKGTGAFTYGYYYRNNRSRGIYDVFRSNDTSHAQAIGNGEVLLDGEGNPILDTYGNYRLMTVTTENHVVGEGSGYTNANLVTYVVTMGSTEMASNALLSSNAYGNTDLLLETFRAIGKEVAPTGMSKENEFRSLYDDEMTQTSSTTEQSYYTEKGNTVWTVVLALLPAVCFTAAGIVVMVKRKVKT